MVLLELLDVRWRWFLLLTVWYGIAVLVNHIDDTDETYGYWEPLHYLTFGKGMQTWEYAPQYAIRTYSFLFPFYCIAKILCALQLRKSLIFICLRSSLGLISVISQSIFIDTISEVFDNEIGLYTGSLIILSPGIFYASTSFLPSAVGMNLLMLSCSSWLRGRFTMSIFWGCVAVLATGWPFIGVLFLPLGLHMIVQCFNTGKILHTRSQTNLNPRNALNPEQHSAQSSWKFIIHQRGILAVIKLIMVGLLLVAAVQFVVMLIDSFYYRKW